MKRDKIIEIFQESWSDLIFEISKETKTDINEESSFERAMNFWLAMLTKKNDKWYKITEMEPYLDLLISSLDLVKMGNVFWDEDGINYCYGKELFLPLLIQKVDRNLGKSDFIKYIDEVDCEHVARIVYNNSESSCYIRYYLLSLFDNNSMTYNLAFSFVDQFKSIMWHKASETLLRSVFLLFFLNGIKDLLPLDFMYTYISLFLLFIYGIFDGLIFKFIIKWKKCWRKGTCMNLFLHKVQFLSNTPSRMSVFILYSVKDGYKHVEISPIEKPGLSTMSKMYVHSKKQTNCSEIINNYSFCGYNFILFLMSNKYESGSFIVTPYTNFTDYRSFEFYCVGFEFLFDFENIEFIHDTISLTVAEIFDVEYNFYNDDHLKTISKHKKNAIESCICYTKRNLFHRKCALGYSKRFESLAKKFMAKTEEYFKNAKRVELSEEDNITIDLIEPNDKDIKYNRTIFFDKSKTSSSVEVCVNNENLSELQEVEKNVLSYRVQRDMLNLITSTDVENYYEQQKLLNERKKRQEFLVHSMMLYSNKKYKEEYKLCHKQVKHLQKINDQLKQKKDKLHNMRNKKSYIETISSQMRHLVSNASVDDFKKILGNNLELICNINPESISELQVFFDDNDKFKLCRNLTNNERKYYFLAYLKKMLPVRLSLSEINNQIIFAHKHNRWFRNGYTIKSSQRQLKKIVTYNF